MSLSTGYTIGSGFLGEIDRALDWNAFEDLLASIHRQTTGAPGYPPATMLKIILLQEWFTMSDPAAEEAVRDRMSFRRFCGISLDRDTPDHASIRRFRETIDKLGLWEALLAETKRQLDARGLIVERGALAGATLIAAEARRPHEGDAANERDSDARDATKRRGKPHLARADLEL